MKIFKKTGSFSSFLCAIVIVSMIGNSLSDGVFVEAQVVPPSVEVAPPMVLTEGGLAQILKGPGGKYYFVPKAGILGKGNNFYEGILGSDGVFVNTAMNGDAAYTTQQGPFVGIERRRILEDAPITDLLAGCFTNQNGLEGADHQLPYIACLKDEEPIIINLATKTQVIETDLLFIPILGPSGISQAAYDYKKDWVVVYGQNTSGYVYKAEDQPGGNEPMPQHFAQFNSMDIHLLAATTNDPSEPTFVYSVTNDGKLKIIQPSMMPVLQSAPIETGRVTTFEELAVFSAIEKIDSMDQLSFIIGQASGENSVFLIEAWSPPPFNPGAERLLQIAQVMVESHPIGGSIPMADDLRVVLSGITWYQGGNGAFVITTDTANYLDADNRGDTIVYEITGSAVQYLHLGNINELAYLDVTTKLELTTGFAVDILSETSSRLVILTSEGVNGYAYVRDFDVSFLPCDATCATCVAEGATECLSCKEGYEVETTAQVKGACIVSTKVEAECEGNTIENCDECVPEGGKCRRCTDNYGLVDSVGEEGGTECIKCFDSHCMQCDHTSDLVYCQRCEAGFQVNLRTKLCESSTLLQFTAAITVLLSLAVLGWN